MKTTDILKVAAADMFSPGVESFGFFENLPADVLQLILAYLPLEDRGRWAQINKHAADVLRTLPHVFRNAIVTVDNDRCFRTMLDRRVGGFVFDYVGEELLGELIAMLQEHPSYPLFYLGFPGCELAHLPAALNSSSFQRLRRLDISNNSLTTMPAVLPPHLAELDLSSNEIRELPADAGSALYMLAPTLKILGLYDNEISCLRDEIGM